MIFFPEHWALRLLPFKQTGNLPLVLIEVCVTGCLKEKNSQFSFVVWHVHFTLHLELFLSYLPTSFILRAKFSLSRCFFLETTNLSLLSLSLIVYGVGKEHLESEVVLKRIRNIKLDNKKRHRKIKLDCLAVEQNEWKFYAKYMFLGMFRNKNGIDSTLNLLSRILGDF